MASSKLPKETRQVIIAAAVFVTPDVRQRIETQVFANVLFTMRLIFARQGSFQYSRHDERLCEANTSKNCRVDTSQFSVWLTQPRTQLRFSAPLYSLGYLMMQQEKRSTMQPFVAKFQQDSICNHIENIEH